MFGYGLGLMHLSDKLNLDENVYGHNGVAWGFGAMSGFSVQHNFSIAWVNNREIGGDFKQISVPIYNAVLEVLCKYGKIQTGTSTETCAALVVCLDKTNFKDGVDYVGSDLVKGGLNVSKVSECCSRCIITQGCKYWTFGKDDNKCWLKTNMNGNKAKLTRISGSLVNAPASKSTDTQIHAGSSGLHQAMFQVHAPNLK